MPTSTNGTVTASITGTIHQCSRASTTAMPTTRTATAASPSRSSNACLTGPCSGAGCDSICGPAAMRRSRSAVSGLSTCRYSSRARFSVRAERKPRRSPISMRRSVRVRAEVSRVSTPNSARSASTGVTTAAHGSRPPASSSAVATNHSVASTSSGPVAAPAARAASARITAAAGASSKTIRTPLSSAYRRPAKRSRDSAPISRPTYIGESRGGTVLTVMVGACHDGPYSRKRAVAVAPAVPTGCGLVTGRPLPGPEAACRRAPGAQNRGWWPGRARRGGPWQSPLRPRPSRRRP